MPVDANRRRAFFSWLFVGALFVLCGVLGVMQYSWIGEVTMAARDRMRTSLQSSLNRVSQDFGSVVTAACRSLIPATTPVDARALEEATSALYVEAKKNGRAPQLFQRVALVFPENGTAELRKLNFATGRFEPAQWPVEWTGLQNAIEGRIEARALREGFGRGRGGGPPGRGNSDDGPAFEIPVFRGGGEGGFPAPFGRQEIGWMIFELDLDHVREAVLPELVQRDIEGGGASTYEVEVVTKSNPPAVIYQSDAGAATAVRSADASVGLFEISFDQLMRRGPGGRDGGRDFERGRGAGFGKWQMYVRHRAGSLETVAAQARRRTLALIGGVLLLVIVTAGALMRFTRRAEKLAQLQMDFVAGVSHELRTPLTVIHTAAYNLRGKLAQNPAQVERYGALIQQESGRLRDLVEQVLQFASAGAGRVIQATEPLSVESVIDQTVESSKSVVQAAHCTIEKTVDAGLPQVMGDPLALKHALQNLVSNAAKYGAKDHGWIGISASRASDLSAIEIRVADHGPGIPADEQAHIFDPFFRGRRALQDQVHGTGLGLNLVKKIVEAHGGTIRVQSEPDQGTEFIVRIPAAPGAPA